jgi:DNA modification methylase
VDALWRQKQDLQTHPVHYISGKLWICAMFLTKTESQTMTLNSLGEITIFTGNAANLPFPDNSVDLIISRPTLLNLTKETQNKKGTDQDGPSEKEVLKTLSKITKEAHRVLKNNGSFIVANQEYLNLDVRYLIQNLDFSDFNYYGKILHNSYDSDNIDFMTYQKINSESLTVWHHFVKGKEAFVNPFKVKKYNNPVWDMPTNNMDSTIDDWMAQKYESVVGAMNQEIPKRFIEMFSKKGHVVLDMFGGTGVTSVAAAALGRHAISNDLSEDMASATKLRIMLSFGEKYFNEKVKVVKDERLNNKKFRVKR